MRRRSSGYRKRLLEGGNLRLSALLPLLEPTRLLARETLPSTLRVFLLIFAGDFEARSAYDPPQINAHPKSDPRREGRRPDVVARRAQVRDILDHLRQLLPVRRELHLGVAKALVLLALLSLLRLLRLRRILAEPRAVRSNSVAQRGSSVYVRLLRLQILNLDYALQ